MKNCDRVEISLYSEDEIETPEEAEEHSTPGYAEAVRDMTGKATGGWGWCTAVVRATIRKKGRVVGEGCAHLGHCSYLSAIDFALSSGYLSQMVEEAVSDAIAEK